MAFAVCIPKKIQRISVFLFRACVFRRNVGQVVRIRVRRPAFLMDSNRSGRPWSELRTSWQGSNKFVAHLANDFLIQLKDWIICLNEKNKAHVSVKAYRYNLYICRTIGSLQLIIAKMRKVILITGGARSGKSSYAEKIAKQLSPNPIYMATSRIWDEEFRQRVIRHQKARGEEWTNIEEEKELSRHNVEGRVVLIDCVTLWGTNFFFDNGSDVDKSLQEIKEEFDRFTLQNATFIFVTNEIGMGGTSENEVQRKFTDFQGWVNQYIAAHADQVIFMISGIPVVIKQ